MELLSKELLRMSLSVLTSKTGTKIIRLDNGLLKNAGVREGFIVVAIDRQFIRSNQDLKDGLTSKKGGVLIEGVYPNGLRAYYGIGL